MSNIDSHIQHFLKECEDDYVGLWSLLRRLRTSSVEPSMIMETAIISIRSLLTSEKIIAGTFQGESFCRWKMPVDAIITKIQNEWQRLGRDPDIGEIVWFTANDGEP